MRKININTITQMIIQLCAEANLELRRDVLFALKVEYRKETNARAKKILMEIIDNAGIAEREKLAICQDTGLPIVFLEIGQNVQFIGGDLNKAVQKGIELGYKKASLRNSIIADPLNRGKSKFSPGIIHTEIVKGSRLKIAILPKGFGCENKSALKMFNPTVSLEEIERFIIDTVKTAGPDACPPYVVGVGIGGTADYAGYLAKKALLRKIRNPKSEIRNKSKFPNLQISKLERDLLANVNKLNIGPMGLGGKTTALAVNIQTYPTHIAGLPVAVNISCHALRSATKTL
jgi:fumarate hydratase subunit alpha